MKLNGKKYFLHSTRHILTDSIVKELMFPLLDPPGKR